MVARKDNAARIIRKIELIEEIDYSLDEVILHGKVSGTPATRNLPSGDSVVEFRLVLKRVGRDGVDTLDIGAWSAQSRRSALSLQAGQWIEVTGAIHRRFWQSPTGLASRWQIEASTIRRI